MNRQPLQHKPWLTHRWQKGSRYYEAHLKRDLFGWVVVRNWGGIGLPAGRRVTAPVSSYDEGLSALKTIFSKRQKRKYVLCQ